MNCQNNSKPSCFRLLSRSVCTWLKPVPYLLFRGSLLPPPPSPLLSSLPPRPSYSPSPLHLRSQNWCEAVQWYCKVLREGTKIEESPFDEPHYTIQARVAQMYSIGGHNLEKDPQRAGDLYTEAAESAMTAMKGKLSSKYYILAEEAC